MSDLALTLPNARGAELLRATGTMISRSVRLSRRNLDALITSLMLPIMLMLLFVYLFGGAINTGTRYVTYVVPGVILLCAGFGSSTTAVSVSLDMANGIIDRFRSMDISPAAIVAGHVVASVVRNIVSSALVFGVALAIGYRPHASVAEWLAVIGILLLFMFAVSWLAAVFGLLAKSAEAANAFTFVVMFVPYASSAFVPIHTMAGWLQGFSRHQPCTPITESLRALLAGHAAGSNAITAVTWCLGILAVSMVASVAAFRRRTRS
jgi:ABC-2 type transport system permease protein